MTVMWSQRAEADLDGILEGLAAQFGPHTAGRRMEWSPKASPQRKVGSRLLRGYPFRSWMVWYTVEDGRVRIERVIPGPPDPRAVLGEE